LVSPRKRESRQIESAENHGGGRRWVKEREKAVENLFPDLRGWNRGLHRDSGKKKKEGKKMKKLVLLGVLGFFVLAGCGGYWMVTDPTTKNVYYTEEVKQGKSGGAVKFIDAKTGNEVNIQNSELKEVTKDEFKAAVGKK
jgi:hypothetical protein